MVTVQSAIWERTAFHGRVIPVCGTVRLREDLEMKTKNQTTILFLAVALLCVVGRTSEAKDSGRQDPKPNILIMVPDTFFDITFFDMPALAVSPN